MCACKTFKTVIRTMDYCSARALTKTFEHFTSGKLQLSTQPRWQEVSGWGITDNASGERTSGSASCSKQGQQWGQCSKHRWAAEAFFRNLLFEHEAALCFVSPQFSCLQPDSAAPPAEFGYFKLFVYMDTSIIYSCWACFLQYSLPGLEVGWLILKLCQKERKGNPAALAHHG